MCQSERKPRSGNTGGRKYETLRGGEAGFSRGACWGAVPAWIKEVKGEDGEVTKTGLGEDRGTWRVGLELLNMIARLVPATGERASGAGQASPTDQATTTGPMGGDGSRIGCRWLVSVSPVAATSVACAIRRRCGIRSRKTGP